MGNKNSVIVVNNNKAKQYEELAKSYSEIARESQETCKKIQENIEATKDAVDTASENALSSISAEQSSAENSIETAKTSALTAIESAQTTAETAISTEQAAAQAAISADKTSALTDITSAKSDYDANASAKEATLNTLADSLQDEITAAGTSEYNKILQTGIDAKQDKLTAGDNITIVDNVISATGGGASYTAGDGISISDDNVISSTATSAAWGSITGDITTQSDLTTNFYTKTQTDTLLKRLGLITATVVYRVYTDNDDLTTYLDVDGSEVYMDLYNKLGDYAAMRMYSSGWPYLKITSSISGVIYESFSAKPRLTAGDSIVVRTDETLTATSTFYIEKDSLLKQPYYYIAGDVITDTLASDGRIYVAVKTSETIPEV